MGIGCDWQRLHAVVCVLYVLSDPGYFGIDGLLLENELQGFMGKGRVWLCDFGCF